MSPINRWMAPCLLAVTQAATAEVLSVGVEAGVRLERVEEFRSSYQPGTGPRKLVEETGARPALGLRGGVRIGELEALLRVQRAVGILAYRGQTNLGSEFSSHTHYRDTTLDLLLSYPLGRVRPKAGVRQDWRYRRIAGDGGVAGLTERYVHRWLLAGVSASEAPWRIDIEFAHGVSGDQEVEFEQTYDDAKLPQGDAWGMRFALGYELSRRQSLELVFEHIDSGRSPTAVLNSAGVPTAATVFQPAMRRQSLGLWYRATW